MPPQRFNKIEEIFHAALELAPDERESFLDEACGGDAEMRREAASLLRFETPTADLFKVSPVELAAGLFSATDNIDFSGRQINQYKILSLLGQGGMGAVYLAEDSRLERRVAVKLLSGEFAADETRLNRFFQEAKAASALNHPNILTVHEIGELDETRFMVTEYINGQILREYLAEQKPPLEKILELAAQIASALSAAHTSGIIHRDIKPDNIMVREDGLVKILDFGIAKLNDPAKSAEIDKEAATRAAAMTLPGMVIGTPKYMSPEQARGQKVDFRTDIFSFGVVLYEMLAGRAPFTGATPMDIIGSILKDEPPPLSEFLPEIPYELEHIVEKTLRKDREQRYQHIKDLLIDLNDAKKTLEFSPRRIHQTDPVKAPATAETESGRPRNSHFPAVSAAFFLVIAGGLIAGIWWFLPTSGGGGQPEIPLKPAEIISWASMSDEFYSTGTFSPDGKMIAFASTRTGGKQLWIKQTATSGEAVQITRDEFNNEQPIWSPGGEELAFFSTRGNHTGIWRIPILGGSPKFVATIEDGSSLLRLWSKNGLIYYESEHDLYAINADSGEIKQITDLDQRMIKAESVSVSPDERQIAYVTVEEEKWSVWTKDMAGGEPQQLLSADSEIKNTAWHTDGRRIFYSRLVGGTFQIFVTDPHGAPPKQISFGDRDALVLDVAPDGTKILFGSAKEESDIWQVSLRDPKDAPVASDIDSELWASAAPDGKSIAYQSIKNLSQGNNLFSGKILVKKLNSGEPPQEVAPNGYLPLWSPDGEMLAYMEISGNKNRIAAIRVAGGQKQLVTDNAVAINNTLLPYNHLQAGDFSWSPDSRKIAYVSRRSGQHNIWRAGPDGAENFQLTANTDDKLYFYCPLWAPDGTRLAFTSRTGNRQGKPTFGVWVIDTETKSARLLSQQKAFFRLLGWEPGGSKLYLVSTGGSETNSLHGEASILQLDIDSGSIQPGAVFKDVYLANIHLAPDGKSVAFAAHREGKDNLWLVPVAGGAAKQLTVNNDGRLYFSSLAWSPDGSAIFFGKQTRYSLLSMLTNFN